jgi:phosphatidylglycerophosphate synthase
LRNYQGDRTPLKNLFATVPNRITAIRFFLIPVLWICAWLGLPAYIGFGIFISALTDFLDGYFARKLNQFSEFGGRFDALADNVMLPSALIWLWMFHPNIFSENRLLCAVGVILYLSYMLVGWIKFRQFANLHLYSTRIAAVMLYLFIPFTLIMGQYSPVLFKTSASLFILSAIECLAVLLIISEFSDHLGSLYFVMKRSKAGK